MCLVVLLEFVLHYINPGTLFLSKLNMMIWWYLNALFYDGEDNLLRVGDPLFVDACQSLTVSRYYNCDIAAANDSVEIVNNRIWQTCPTYIGMVRPILHAQILLAVHLVDYNTKEHSLVLESFRITSCHPNVKCQNVKNIYWLRRMSRVRIGGAGGRRNVRLSRIRSSEQFCFQMCLECGDGGGTFSRWRQRVPDSWFSDTESLGDIGWQSVALRRMNARLLLF